MTTPPHPPSHTPPQNNITIKGVLDNIITRIPTDIVFVYTYDKNSKRLILVEHSSKTKPLIKQDQTAIRQWIHQQAVSLVSTAKQTPQIVALEEETCEKIRSVILWPIEMHGNILALLVVGSYTPGRYRSQDIDTLTIWIQMARVMLEHHHLKKQLTIAEATTTTAMAIARQPTHHAISILRDHLFSDRISSCLILLFGPAHPDRPHGPFDYLEIKESWSRKLGDNIGIGQRFDLIDHQEIIQNLAKDSFITITDIDMVNNRVDEFNRKMLKNDNVQSMTLLPLQSEERKLGILLITTNEPYEFSHHELHSYQTIGELITMTALAEMLQQQADFVQQGRAALLEAMTDSVVMVLPDEAASILTVNQQFTRMFNITEQKIQGISLVNLLHEMVVPAAVRRELYDQWCLAQPRDTTELQGEFIMPDAKGIPCYIQWYSRPVYQEDNVIGRIYTLHDITPERSGERLRNELLSRISHEMRTPLTSIRGFAEFILEATGDDLPPLAREYTDIILKSAINLHHRFSDILQLSRANAGELQLHISEANLLDIVVEVVARLEPQYKKRGQRIVMDLEDSLPNILVDVERVDQVITNLLTNAIKYAPEKTRIYAHAQVIQSASVLSKSAPIADIHFPCMLVSIIDEGMGLSQEEAGKIFTPFYRTAMAQKQQIEGSGLGLAIASSLIELHQGKIWAEASTHHKPGGKFFFTLPVNT